MDLPAKWIEMYLASGATIDAVWSPELEALLDEHKATGTVRFPALDGADTRLYLERVEGFCVMTAENQAANYSIGELKAKLMPAADRDEPWRG